MIVRRRACLSPILCRLLHIQQRSLCAFERRCASVFCVFLSPVALYHFCVCNVWWSDSHFRAVRVSFINVQPQIQACTFVLRVQRIKVPLRLLKVKDNNAQSRGRLSGRNGVGLRNWGLAVPQLKVSVRRCRKMLARTVYMPQPRSLFWRRRFVGWLLRPSGRR